MACVRKECLQKRWREHPTGGVLRIFFPSTSACCCAAAWSKSVAPSRHEIRLPFSPSTMHALACAQDGSGSAPPDNYTALEAKHLSTARQEAMSSSFRQLPSSKPFRSTFFKVERFVFSRVYQSSQLWGSGFIGFYGLEATLEAIMISSTIQSRKLAFVELWYAYEGFLQFNRVRVAGNLQGHAIQSRVHDSICQRTSSSA